MNSILLTYISFMFACLVVIISFITATTYTQLALAVILYPLLVFFAFKVLSLKPKKHHSKISPTGIKSFIKSAEDQIGITDTDKRSFLKLIGTTGVLFFLISIFGRRVESFLFGQTLVKIPSSIISPPSSVANTPPVSPTDEYKISEIDDDIIGFYGFVKQDGGWFIMKVDTETGTFRYSKGNSDFPSNWKNRQNLKYDYFHNVFKP